MDSIARDVTGTALRILVVADPGLSTRRVESVRPLLTSRLSRRVRGHVDVEITSQLVDVRPDGSLGLDAAARLRAENEHLDATLVLTEMPRHVEGTLLVAEAYPGDGIAALSWPALGIHSRAGRIVDVLVDCLGHITGRLPPAQERAGKDAWRPVGDSGGLILSAPRLRGPLSAILGMVATNAPWQTVRKMSGALAAASAVGAFGIFYSSIWQMSAALSTARLLFIGVLAMTTMVAWLVISNGLWDEQIPGRSRRSTLLYNISTLLTLLLCVLALYVTLVVLILVGGIIVIDPQFMQEVLGRPVDFSHYLGIAWLSAAMGVVAGGLGTSFDRETDIRQLTHGSRARWRERVEDDEDDEDDEAASVATPESAKG